MVGMKRKRNRREGKGCIGGTGTKGEEGHCDSNC
jgi:hypothetical protein